MKKKNRLYIYVYIFQKAKLQLDSLFFLLSFVRGFRTEVNGSVLRQYTK